MTCLYSARSLPALPLVTLPYPCRIAPMHRSVSTSGLALVAWLLVTAGHAAAQTAESPVDLFERTIRPLLLDRCIECHGPTKQEHQVRLDRRSDVLSGSASDIP